MADVVERMGAEWVLSGTKGVTDRTFSAIARFALDSSQQTRLVESVIQQSILEVAENICTAQRMVLHSGKWLLR